MCDRNLAALPGLSSKQHLGFGLLLVRTVDAQPQRYMQLAIAPIAKIGYYSYSIYLWHGFACRLLPHSTFPGVLGCVAAAILVGIGMAKLVEYPVLALRDRLLPAAAESRRVFAVS